MQIWYLLTFAFALCSLIFACEPEIVVPTGRNTGKLYVDGYVDDVYGARISVTRPISLSIITTPDSFAGPRKPIYDVVSNAEVFLCPGVPPDGASSTDCTLLEYDDDGYYTLSAETYADLDTLHVRVVDAGDSLISVALAAPPSPSIDSFTVVQYASLATLSSDDDDGPYLTLDAAVAVEDGYDAWVGPTQVGLPPIAEGLGTTFATSRTSPRCIVEFTDAEGIVIGSACMESGPYPLTTVWQLPAGEPLARFSAASPGLADYVYRLLNEQYDNFFPAGLTEPLLFRGNVEGDGFGFIARTTTRLLTVEPQE